MFGFMLVLCHACNCCCVVSLILLSFVIHLDHNELDISLTVTVLQECFSETFINIYHINFHGIIFLPKFEFSWFSIKQKLDWIGPIYSIELLYTCTIVHCRSPEILLTVSECHISLNCNHLARNL